MALQQTIQLEPELDKHKTSPVPNYIGVKCCHKLNNKTISCQYFNSDKIANQLVIFSNKLANQPVVTN